MWKQMIPSKATCIFTFWILFSLHLITSATALSKQEELLRDYVARFNANDEELYVEDIPNSQAFEFLRGGIPFFECPDKTIEEIYYFRWWTWRKHIKTIPTPSGNPLVVITEFMPSVQWAGQGNTICAGAGHHIMEGRWFHGNDSILDGYSYFWLREGGNPRRYSFWIASSLWNRFLVNGNSTILKTLLPKLTQNYRFWERMRLDPNGLYWQKDDFDGMEMSIGGSPFIHGYRATINSYQFGDALAIAKIAILSNEKDIAVEYKQKAAALKSLIESQLWDPSAEFFKVIPRVNGSTFVNVRELHGFTPWYFNLPSNDKSIAWKQVVDEKGFLAKYGLTSAEQRHPRFSLSYVDHECQWNGPSWPFATSITLTAMANLLNKYKQSYVTKSDYFMILQRYAVSQHRTLADGSVIPWIDENLHPYTGDWISRTRLMKWKDGTWAESKGGKERGKDYNHSTFVDLVINGLIGLRPRSKDIVDVNPLVPPGVWTYFLLDNVEYHGRRLTILWDETGEYYQRGRGLCIFVDGVLRAQATRLRRIKFSLVSKDESVLQFS